MNDIYGTEIYAPYTRASRNELYGYDYLRLGQTIGQICERYLRGAPYLTYHTSGKVDHTEWDDFITYIANKAGRDDVDAIQLVGELAHWLEFSNSLLHGQRYHHLPITIGNKHYAKLGAEVLRQNTKWDALYAPSGFGILPVKHPGDIRLCDESTNTWIRFTSKSWPLCGYLDTGRIDVDHTFLPEIYAGVPLRCVEDEFTRNLNEGKGVDNTPAVSRQPDVHGLPRTVWNINPHLLLKHLPEATCKASILGGDMMGAIEDALVDFPNDSISAVRLASSGKYIMMDAALLRYVLGASEDLNALAHSGELQKPSKSMPAQRIARIKACLDCPSNGISTLYQPYVLTYYMYTRTGIRLRTMSAKYSDIVLHEAYATHALPPYGMDMVSTLRHFLTEGGRALFDEMVAYKNSLPREKLRINGIRLS